MANVISLPVAFDCSKRAEEGDAATLLNVSVTLKSSVSRSVGLRQDLGQRLRPLMSAGPGHNLLQFRVGEVQ